MERELYIDKYRPTSLDDLTFNRKPNAFFKAIAKRSDVPHLIIEGARGSGKKLRAQLYLKEKYGSFATLSRTINLSIPGKSEVKPVHVLYSKYHHQLNPSIHNIYDRSLIQCFVNEIIHTRIISGIAYRIIIVENADLLSVEAQESLRRTLETCIGTCRFIFLVNNEGNIIQPLYSRCIRIKCASPTVSEMCEIMSNICVQEGLEIGQTVLESIACASNRNLQRAVHLLNKYALSLELKSQGLLSTSSPRQMPKALQTFKREDHDNVYSYCLSIVNTIIKGSNMHDTIKSVRSQIYELVNYCVSCRSLFPILLDITLDKLPNTAHEAKLALCQIASERDESIRVSSKDIYHVEGFCLYIFKIIKAVMITRQRSVPKIAKKSSGTKAKKVTK